MSHNWYAHCAKCDKLQEKKRMRRLLTTDHAYGTPHILCFLCESCFCALMDELEVSM